VVSFSYRQQVVVSNEKGANEMTTTTTLKQTLEAFLASDEFSESLVKATKASWGGSGYSVELFEDGHWRVLWNNEIGNLYQSPGTILGLPTLDDNDYTSWMEEHAEKLGENEYWYLVYQNDEDELKRDLREKMDF